MFGGERERKGECVHIRRKMFEGKTDVSSYKVKYIHIFIHTHTYTHTYIDTYILTYTHTYKVTVTEGAGKKVLKPEDRVNFKTETVFNSKRVVLDRADDKLLEIKDGRYSQGNKMLDTFISSSS